MFLLRQGGKTDYNYKEYYLDTEDELGQVRTDDCCPGSVVYVIATKKLYILNSKKEWIEQ